MFSNLTGIFFSAFLVAFSGAMMPGPLLAVTIDESARRGAAAGPLLILGHMLLEAGLVIALALGVAAFLGNARVLAAIGLVGGTALCWMGVSMLRSASRALVEGDNSRAYRLHPVTAGMVTSLANPYWSIWWATIGLGYLTVALRQGIAGIAAFFGGHILADFLWYGAVSFGVSRGFGFLSLRIHRLVLALCGLALIVFGLWFVRAGFATMVTSAQ